jgi:mRNA interferase MazF
MTRGDVWWADFGVPLGSEPGFRRPVLIVQDNAFNDSAIRTIVVLPFSTNPALADAPGNVFLEKEATGLSKDSVLVTSQIAAVERQRLVERIFAVDQRIFSEIEDGLRLVLGMAKAI